MEIARDPVAAERARCAELCRRRAELWRGTSAATKGPREAREEARARANEATYLADLIASGVDLDDDGRVDA